MDIASVDPDGLRISITSSLSQLAAHEVVTGFAAGLIPAAVAQTEVSATLAEALFYGGPAIYPLFTTLLVLDAEVEATVDDKRRVFPFPSFLSYRSRLAPRKLSFNHLRLPPLNPDGHYALTFTTDKSCLAVRLDLHPRHKVAGHVRIALSSATRFPIRLQAAEHRLDRKVVARSTIEEAAAGGRRPGSRPLSIAERAMLIEVLAGFLGA